MQEQGANKDSFLVEIAHRLIHPFGGTLKRMSPRVYEIARWEIAKTGLMKNVFNKPMTHGLFFPLVVQKGDVVFDVGANVGRFTLPLARLVGKEGVVHAFEPISETFHELKTNIVRDQLSSRVVLNQVALGDSPRVASFTIPRQRKTEAALMPHSAENWVDYRSDPSKYVVETCTIVTIDEYLKANRIDRVSFVKCDVEGGELQVLKGATSLLRSPTPPILQLEIFEKWTKDFGYHPRDLLSFLKSEAGYECYWIHENGLRLVNPDEEVIPGIFYRWLDYLCIVPHVHQKTINLQRFIA